MKRLFISVHIKMYQILLYFFCISLFFPSSAITEPIQSITAEVTTADVWWAGTDNAVHLVLWGPNVKDWKLNNPGNDFERGDTNTFRLTSNLPNDTSDIRGTISIWKSPDHWYDSGGWRLAGLRVYYNDNRSNSIYQNNNINKWLEDDNREWSDTFDIQNIGCTFSIDSISLVAPHTGDKGYTVNVTTSRSSCTWTATSNDPSWIHITGGSSGKGDGIVTFDVENNSGSARSGTITIASQTFTVEQCDNTIVEKIALMGTSVSSGAPIWMKATFTNTTGNTILTIKPDCYNTCFWVTDSSGKVVPTRCLIRSAYGIPVDVVSIPSGSSYTVNCDISKWYPALAPDHSPYNVIATYANYITDPDYNPVTQQCSAPDKTECYDLWRGAAGSGKTTVTVLPGAAVRQVIANVSFNPNRWYTQWTSPPVTAYIRNIEGHDVSDVNPSTILLNGTVPIISGSNAILKEVLKVEFDGGAAVQSLGTAVPGTTVNPTIQGGFYSTPNEIFYAERSVVLYGVQRAGCWGLERRIMEQLPRYQEHKEILK